MNRYTIEEQIGVCAYTCIDTDGSTKVIKKTTTNESFVHARMSHPFIVKLLHCFIETPDVMLVLEHCPGGCLTSCVILEYDKYHRGFTQEETIKVANNIADALCYIKTLHVVHRDVKCDNILISNDTYKLCDFGIACDIDACKGKCGTYFAAEMFVSEFHDYAVDVWGYGVMLYCTLLSEIPFEHPTTLESIQMSWTSGHFDPNSELWDTLVTASMKSYIGMCLQIDPSERLTIETARTAIALLVK
jgi:serine/threonine protein kinase